METFADRLKSLVGVGSVSIFAERCGVPESLVKMYLSGARTPGMDSLVAIQRATGATLDWLVMGGGEHPNGDAYQPPCLTFKQAHIRAMALLKGFDGQPNTVIRQVLRQANALLDVVSSLDCGESTEYSRAAEGLFRDAGRSG